MDIAERRFINKWINDTKIIANEMDINEEKEHNGLTVKAIEVDNKRIHCSECAFGNDCCYHTEDLISSVFGNCISDYRKDGKQIIFSIVSIDKDKKWS